MAVREMTELMNKYRECSRNLWNVYFSGLADIGSSLDAFEQIRRILFDSLVLSELPSERNAEGGNMPQTVLKVVPRPNSLILIRRLAGRGEAGYWDQEKDMVVGPGDVSLEFVDYFDFSQAPIREFRYCLCRILRFTSHVAYEGREALVEASNVKVFHEEESQQP